LARNEYLAFTIPLVTVLVFGLVWYYFLIIGALQFNAINTIPILSSIIQGMSALLSVAIAMIIFRVQSLENRNQSLEQTTLNYITQLSDFVYAKWTTSIEEHIESGVITKRYLEKRKGKFEAINLKDQELEEDRANQQESLIESLSLHRATKRKISRLKVGALISTIILMLPIIFSLLLLMVADSLGGIVNYLWVSAMVILCVLGISLLIASVADSTVSD
jgi:hypothetical protein